MADMEQIRPLAGVPDHGFGLLGRLVHSVLSEYAGVSLPAPRLHLGLNTLPNPPFPMAAAIPFGHSGGWDECDADLAAFLALGARALRGQPTPGASGYTEHVRILQRVLRFDSIVMAWHDPGLVTHAIVAVAADRDGNALAGWIPSPGSAADIEITGDETPADTPIIVLLRDVLLAQYEWTAAVFGLVP